jgi:hypothetical protein
MNHSMENNAQKRKQVPIIQKVSQVHRLKEHK